MISLARLGALSLVLLLGAVFPASAARPQTIRVGIKFGESAPPSVRISGQVQFRAERTSGLIGKPMPISAGGGTLHLGAAHDGKPLGRWVELSSAKEDRPLQLDGVAYRGDLRLDLQPGGKIRVVNTVEVESYLRGVVPNEMFAHDEAYRVQAVIARTYALYVRDLERKHHPDGFDICATGHCQVYRGLDSETPRSDEAVAATRGLVLTRQGSVIFSAYHTNAGGQTVEVDEAWPGSIREAFRYLPQVDSPYDEEARRIPGYEWCWEWRRTVTPAALAARLGLKARALGEVRDLLVLRRNRAGRVATLRVIGSRGSLDITGPPQIRVLLDAPSARFEVSRSAEGFQLHGWGYGDGVGLSQHGALGMARAGYPYESILAHYYRGVEIAEEYGAGPARPLRVQAPAPRQTTAREEDRS